MPRLLLGCALALGACDDAEETDSGSGSESSGGEDRAATILMLDGNASSGQSVFANETCSTAPCHGADGNSGDAENLSERVPMLSDDQIVDVLLHGSGDMTPQAHLSDQELADVLAWLNETFA